MKKLLLLTAIALSWLGVHPHAPNAAQKAITLEFSHFFPSQDRVALLVDDWARDIEKRTSGRIRVKVHPANTLTPAPQTFDSVVRGIADIGFGATGITPGRFPVLEVMDLPWGTITAQNSTALANDLINQFKPAEFQRVKVLNINSMGPMFIHTTKPVKTLEDLKGLKLRVPGGLTTDIVKSLGAVPLVISPGETYDALKKGVADGVVAGMIGLDIFRFGEVTNYTTMNLRTGMGMSGYVVMNLDKWNSLSNADKKIMDELSAEYTDKIAKLFDEMDVATRTGWEKRGHKYIVLTKEEEDRWAARIAPMYEKYVKDRAKPGVPAAEALAFCRDWTKKNLK